MIAAGRLLFLISLLVTAAASPVAVAGRVDVEQPEGILIADPSSALREQLLRSGYSIDGVERLEALSISLMTVRSPRTVTAPNAVATLRAKFPGAIIALDEHVYLAADARSGRGPLGNGQRALKAIGWQAYANSGAAIRIGAIDSSIDLSHPALQDARIVRRSFTSGKAPTKDTAHGTAIAAMLVGKSDGTAITGLLRGATLFHASIFQKSKLGPMASSADFLRAVNWMIKSGVTIINASVSSQSENPVVVYAMAMLEHQKIVLVAAAGNRGPHSPPAYPAAIDTAFAVTAVSIDGSSYGNANTGDYIDIAAPGIDLPTISPRITSGTSLAVPFVTAALARMVQTCGVTPLEAEGSLQANARDLGAPGRDPQFGWGLLQEPRRAGPRSAVRLGPATGAALRRAADQRPCAADGGPMT